MTPEQIALDFYQLALHRGEPKMRCRVGADFVNYFTHCERLNTIGRTGISFIDFINNKDDVLCKGYVQKMIEWYDDNEPWRNEVWVLYRIFNLYFGSINIFQPHIAKYLFDFFQPTCVFTPCAGWGGILTAACAANVPRWVGCETNLNLREPYMKMISELHKHSKTEIDINFIDCIDWMALDEGGSRGAKPTCYDMVLYSPPYYNIEQYTNQPRKSNDDWNAFYKVLWTLSWRGLSKGGWYCVNVSNEIFDIYRALVGREPDYVVPMPNKRRASYHPYCESVFCWKK